MNRRTVGTVLGVLSLLMWFMPFVYVEMSRPFMRDLVPEGATLYQSGQHIGGIAYLLLLAGAGLAVFAWQQKRTLQIISCALGGAICLLFLVQAGASAAWGLIALTIIFVAGGLTVPKREAGHSI